MNNLVVYLVCAGAALLVMVIAYVILILWMRRRMKTVGYIDDEDAFLIRNDLIDAVKVASKQQRMRVSLRGFWKGRHLKRVQRAFLMRPLLECQILFAAGAESTERSKWELWAQETFWFPPKYVVLNDQDWLRMTSNSVPASVVISGAIHGQVILGDNSGVATVGNNNRLSQKWTGEPDPEFIRLIIGALRHDALRQEQTMRQEAESIADSLEADLRNNRWKHIGDTMNLLTGVVANGLVIWATTAGLLAG